MKKAYITLIATILLTGCNTVTNTDTKLESPLQAQNLMNEVNNSEVELAISEEEKDKEKKEVPESLMDISLNILRQNTSKANKLISPLSIFTAIGMTTNGAGGETLTELETFLGADISTTNYFVTEYMKNLASDDKYKVSMANSIWLRDDSSLTVKEDFLQTNKNYYNVDIYKAAFDVSTKDDINKWVSQKTDGQINKLLEEVPDKDVVMYLINALSFDAEWDEIYEQEDIRDNKFTKLDGTTQQVEFMNSNEFGYIELDGATGVTKPYKDNKYSFVALLPAEGETPEQFISNIDGTKLNYALGNISEETVITSIPKFTFEYEEELSSTLKNLGVKKAFDGEKADFKNMATSVNGNIYISRVLHKTKIAVDEKGTKAGAITAVEMKTEGCALDEPDMKEVILDRPFVFMIVDNEYNVPLFMGVLNEVNK